MAEGSAPNIVQICRRMLTANEGQNRFGEVAVPFLSFLNLARTFPTTPTSVLCASAWDGPRLTKVFYVLDPASGALSSLKEMGEGFVMLKAVRQPASLSAVVGAAVLLLCWTAARSFLCLSAICQILCLLLFCR